MLHDGYILMHFNWSFSIRCAFLLTVCEIKLANSLVTNCYIIAKVITSINRNHPALVSFQSWDFLRICNNQQAYRDKNIMSRSISTVKYNHLLILERISKS